MALSLSVSSTVSEMSDILYDFLPGSGNSNYAFPLVCDKVRLSEYWIGGSKKPAINHLLTQIIENRKSQISAFLIETVKQSIMWRRNKNAPLTQEEIMNLNKSLLKLNIKIPELNDQTFIQGLKRTSNPEVINKKIEESEKIKSTNIKNNSNIKIIALNKLKQDLHGLSYMSPIPRGFAFEHFLKEMFEAYDLKPNNAFRNVGEQIDGSFSINNNHYLLEAKWITKPIGQADLLVFSGKVENKAKWTRGLFISESGFSLEGLLAFKSGRPTSIICMDGLDLHTILHENRDFKEVFFAKERKASEKNLAFVPIRELF